MFTKLKHLYYFVDLEMGKLLVSKTKLVFFLFIFLSFTIGLTINDMTPIETYLVYGITFVCMFHSIISIIYIIRKEKRIINIFFKEAQRIIRDSKENEHNKKCKILNFKSKNKL